MNVKIFLKNTTTIDLALLAPNGPIGKSLSVEATFLGKPNAKGMLIDFSHAKKFVKQITSICDHKLIVSHSQLKHQSKTTSFIANNNASNSDHIFAMCAPSSWLYLVSDETLNELVNKNYTSLEAHLVRELTKSVSKNIKKISIKLHELDSDFSYTHTLCKHDGHCQRFHGHSSQLKIYKNNEVNPDLTKQFIQKVSGLYIISKKYLHSDITTKKLQKLKVICFTDEQFNALKSNLSFFDYKSSDGSLSLIISKKSVLLLDQESSIENIAQFLSKDLNQTEENTHIEIYEGFFKGACSI